MANSFSKHDDQKNGFLAPRNEKIDRFRDIRLRLCPKPRDIGRRDGGWAFVFIARWMYSECTVQAGTPLTVT